MAESEATFEQLLDRWHSMPAGDRKAIERAMSFEQRLALEEALAPDESEASGHAAAEYHPYSGTLARILKGAMQDDDHASRGAIAAITPNVRAALRDIHEALTARPAADQRTGSVISWASQALRDAGILR